MTVSSVDKKPELKRSAKEIKCMIMLKVFAKNPESKAADEAGTITQGAQLPATVSTKAHIVYKP